MTTIAPVRRFTADVDGHTAGDVVPAEQVGHFSMYDYTEELPETAPIGATCGVVDTTWSSGPFEAVYLMTADGWVGPFEGHDDPEIAARQ